MNNTDEYYYLVIQIRELLNKHLETTTLKAGLWRIQGLIQDEIEDRDRNK